MKKGMLSIAVILLTMAGIVQAAGDAGSTAGPAIAANDLHGAINLTYTSKYVWRGFTIFGAQSAIHPSVDLNLYNTGFGINVAGHIANSSGYVNGERWDYNIYYANRLWESEWYATNYRLDWVYYNFPKLSSHTRASIDLQELNAVLSWPNLIGVKGLVPSYVLVKLWPSNGESLGGNASGFAHIFMLDYGLAVPAIVPNTAEQVLNLHSEVVYNDGVAPNGANVDHDWSNAVLGVSTDFPICTDLVLTPGIYHQITMDKSVNTEKSITWASLGLTYKF